MTLQGNRKQIASETLRVTWWMRLEVCCLDAAIQIESKRVGICDFNLVNTSRIYCLDAAIRKENKRFGNWGFNLVNTSRFYCLDAAIHTESNALETGNLIWWMSYEACCLIAAIQNESKRDGNREFKLVNVSRSLLSRRCDSYGK